MKTQVNITNNKQASSLDMDTLLNTTDFKVSTITTLPINKTNILIKWILMLNSIRISNTVMVTTLECLSMISKFIPNSRS